MRRISAMTVGLVALGAINAKAAECGGFYPPVRLISSAARVLLVRDLDGDGAPEIVVSGNQVDESNSFSLFANRSDGTFAEERLIASSFGEALEAAGDLDGDGVPELVVSNYWANGIAIYRGKGALQFDGGTAYETATHGGPSLIADTDGDGKPDVISFSFGSGNPVRMHLFRGNGDGTLAAKTTFDTQLANAAQPSLRMISGALEIVASERSGYLGLLRYDRAALSVSRLAAGPGFDLSSRFADVDGDGIADVVNTTDSGGTYESIFVTLANADGTFRERKQVRQPRHVAFPAAVRAADFDGDGRRDLIVQDLQSANLYYFHGEGGGDFAEGVAIDAGAPVNAFAVADFNGDGYADLVTANGDHTISVLLNRGPCPSIRRRAARH